MRSFKGRRVEPRPLTSLVSPAEQAWRQVFGLSMVLMLAVMLWASRDYAIFSDDVIQNWYGHKVLDFWLTLGRDRAAVTDFPERNIQYYGGLFDAVCAALIRLLHTDVWDTRHFFCALTGFGAIWFTARLAKLYGGYPAALAAAWLLFLSPRFFGDSMNNPKDIPYALGMMMGLYCMVRLARSGPLISVRWSVYTALAIAFTINMRVGGIILIPFLGVALLVHYWAYWRPARSLTTGLFLRGAALVAGISVCGFFLGQIGWPYAMQNPILNPLKSLALMSNAYIGTVLFMGRDVLNWEVPWYYVPVYMGVSTPVIVIAGFCCLPVLFVRKRARPELLFLLFALLAPWLYVLFVRAPLYDGWRHFLFLYPLVVLFAALAFVRVAGRLGAVWLRTAFWTLVALAVSRPAAWAVRHHPYESLYYNSLAGGLKGAYGKYETDVFGVVMERACQRLAVAAGLGRRDDTITVATNFDPALAYYYMKPYGAKLLMRKVQFQDRFDADWDYALLRSRGVDYFLIQRGAFARAANMAATTVMDSVPLYVAVQRSPDSSALLLARSLRWRDWNAAVFYAERVIRTEPANETAWIRYGEALYRTGRRAEALTAANRILNLNPLDSAGRALYRQITGREHPYRFSNSPAPRGMRSIFSDN